MNERIDQLAGFLRREWRSFIDETIRPARPLDAAPDEGRLIAQATEGSEARAFLQSPMVQDFMARCEAQLTNAMTNAPLEADAERMRLAVAVQTVRQLQKYLLAKAGDGLAAEKELERMRSGRRDFF